jgi:hypothetical protein
MIIFLNGSINAGKSTVARILVKSVENTALLEIDAFHEMIEWMPINQAVPLNLENAVSVISNFAKRGLNVIVPYPLPQKNYEYMIDNLKGFDTKIYFFTLSPKREKTLTNRGTRELTDQEKDRIKHHYNIGIPSPIFGEIIDNSDQTPQETADYILSKIHELQF